MSALWLRWLGSFCANLSVTVGFVFLRLFVLGIEDLYLAAFKLGSTAETLGEFQSAWLLMGDALALDEWSRARSVMFIVAWNVHLLS